MRRSGKRVLAYFEIGSIENFRPEYPVLRREAPDLLANEWADWPGEYFVRYWDERWWDRVVRPRVDQALRAGFDGVYLDTPLAYEEISLAAAQGRDRERLAADDGRADRPDQRVRQGPAARFPDRAAELPRAAQAARLHRRHRRHRDGGTVLPRHRRAVHRRSWCAENLAHTRALRDAGKFVLAVDYAARAGERPRRPALATAPNGSPARSPSGTLDRITARCG